MLASARKNDPGLFICIVLGNLLHGFYNAYFGIVTCQPYFNSQLFICNPFLLGLMLILLAAVIGMAETSLNIEALKLDIDMFVHITSEENAQL